MRMRIVILGVTLAAVVSLAGCAKDEIETETPASTTTTTKRGTIQVVKDQIPAEGQRKIPVTQEY